MNREIKQDNWEIEFLKLDINWLNESEYKNVKSFIRHQIQEAKSRGKSKGIEKCWDAYENGKFAKQIRQETRKELIEDLIKKLPNWFIRESHLKDLLK